MNTDLDAWRAAMLDSVPAYSAFLFAPPADRYAAMRAIPATTPPPDVPLERPEPVWLRRPPEFPASTRCYMRRSWRGRWVVSLTPDGGEAVEFDARTGRHVKRKSGRHTKHGRLDVEASAAVLAAYDRAEFNRSAARLAFMADTMRERTERAVRLGTGWMRASGFRRWPGEHWLIFDPEREVWSILGAGMGGLDGLILTPAEVEALTIIERGPPPRQRAPTLTVDEVRAELEARGYTVEIGETVIGLDRRDPVVRVHWREIYLTSLFADDSGTITIVRLGKPPGNAATLDNLLAELCRKTASELAHRRTQIQRLMEEIAALETAPPPQPGHTKREK